MHKNELEFWNITLRAKCEGYGTTAECSTNNSEVHKTVQPSKEIVIHLELLIFVLFKQD